MHPCREYWGQDVAYGSLVKGEPTQRTGRFGLRTEFWILDTQDGSRPAPHAELAGLMRRIAGLAGGDEALRQSAAHIKDFLQAGKAAAPAPAGAPPGMRGESVDENGRILGVATLHRTPMLPPGSFAAAAGVASRQEREESSAQLCAEFMRHLSALGQADGVSRIDWVMVRATDTADGARSHLGATPVGPVALKPFRSDAGDGFPSQA
ncbi:MAG TPA: hypothetical protein VES00_21465 [Burkholderiaceae bacterium]|jgi:hypothetical protein|nr:hypothetical protein [Burkholderiaceae bacterium]